MREGMEDYEYLWLLGHASYIIRKDGGAGQERELLGRINVLLWYFRHWIIRSMGREGDADYIGICWSISPDLLVAAADELDALGMEMQAVLEKVYLKGYLRDEAIDSGQEPVALWA